MTELDETQALAVLFANTRRKKRTADLITVARSCQYLLELYGSRKAVADRVGISTEMIRQFLTPLRLPPEAQRLVSERKIDSVDAVAKIVALRGRRRQVQAARALVGSTSYDVRDVNRLIKTSRITARGAKERVARSKLKGLNLFVLDLDDATFNAFRKASKQLRLHPADLLKLVLTDWLRKRRKTDRGQEHP